MDQASMNRWIQELRQTLHDYPGGMGSMNTAMLLRTFEDCRDQKRDLVVIDPQDELYDPPQRWRGDP